MAPRKNVKKTMKKTRAEKGKLISNDRMKVVRLGIWEVIGDTGVYDVERITYHCMKRWCRDQNLCEHRYKCSCPDKERLCKHIHAVFREDKDPYPPKPLGRQIHQDVLCRVEANIMEALSIIKMLDLHSLDAIAHDVSQLANAARSYKGLEPLAVSSDED